MKVMDPYGKTFEIDETALPFWVNRPEYTVLESTGDETTFVGTAISQPEISGNSQTSKAAVRRARNQGESA